MDQTLFTNSEMDPQNVRYSSSSDINTSSAGHFDAEARTINKRRACSNGFPNQLLLQTTTSMPYAWTTAAPATSTNITCCSSSGFGGSNTMAMASSFNSVDTCPPFLVDQQQQLQLQKPLSRSLESLAQPSTSDALLLMAGGSQFPLGDLQDPALNYHRDDSRVNYSFAYDSRMYNHTGIATTTANESFSAGESFLLTSTQHEDFEPGNMGNALACSMSLGGGVMGGNPGWPTLIGGGGPRSLSADDRQTNFDNTYDQIINGMQQCRPFGHPPNNDFDMDEC